VAVLPFAVGLEAGFAFVVIFLAGALVCYRLNEQTNQMI
jgi:hypothetical protein